MKLNIRSTVKAAVYMTIATGFFTMAAYADITGSAPTNSVGDVAGTMIDSFTNLSKVMTAVGYLAGIGFTLASIFKFKQHKDNAQQIPVTTPIALLALGITLLFMPSVFQMGGATLFGTGAESAGVTGITTIPGQNTQP